MNLDQSNNSNNDISILDVSTLDSRIGLNLR